MSSLTVEHLLAIIGAIVIPISVSTYWIATRLSSLESSIKTQKEISDVEQRQVLYRVDKLEKHVHEIRNVLQALTFKLMRGDGFDDNFKTPTGV
jgi:hypothetical protein